MKTTQAVDSARINLLLNELRLPAIKLVWSQVAEQADKEGWPAARFLAAIAEHELAERDAGESERVSPRRACAGKTLDTFDFETVPMLSKAQVMAITAGDELVGQGRQLAPVRPTPGGGKSHWPQPLALP